MTKCQITCKSLQKSSKCQNFLRVWHLVIFRADQLKKPPCISARCPTEYFRIIQNTSKYLARKVFHKIYKKKPTTTILPCKVLHQISKKIPSILKYLPCKVLHHIFQNHSKYFKI